MGGGGGNLIQSQDNSIITSWQEYRTAIRLFGLGHKLPQWKFMKNSTCACVSVTKNNIMILITEILVKFHTEPCLKFQVIYSTFSPLETNLTKYRNL